MGFRHFSIIESEYEELENETDQFSEYHSYYEFFPGNVAKVKNNAGSADVSLFPGEKEPEQGDKIYVTTVNYSTGDSFANYKGKKHFVWAFTDKKNAEDLKNAIKNDLKYFKGVPIENYMWSGYFDTLEDVEILEFKVG